MVMEEEEITEQSLLEAVHKLYANRQTYINAMSDSRHMDSIHQITSIIEEFAGK